MTAILEAALGYAARGWPVFPCSPKNKQPLLATKKDAAGKAIRGTGGVSAASTDPDQVTAWWKRWPQALIGLATGHPTKGTETFDALGAPTSAGMRLFVLDFDPRVDGDSGEVWTLERLKRETEEQLGCPLPPSLTALTPSDGIHLYLLQGPDADGSFGPAITNRGNLPEHVDVRGLGGYVIAPPSVMGPSALKGQGGLRYRWHRKEPVGGIARAPARLLEVLRDRGRAGAAPHPNSGAAELGDARERFAGSATTDALLKDQAVRKYALAGLDAELQAVRAAPSGRRNAQLNESALKISALAAAGAIDATMARLSLESAARDNPGQDSDSQLLATIDSGWSAGTNNPRDLSEIASAARSRAGRQRSSRPHPSAPARSAEPARTAMAEQGTPFRTGRQSEASSDSGESGGAGALSEADKAQLEHVAQAWLSAALEPPPRRPRPTAEDLRKIAWGAGRRIAAELLDHGVVRDALAEASEAADIDGDEIERAIAEGRERPFDPRADLFDLKCSRYPLTDFGIAERFRDRFGEDFRFTTAKGWLGWDGRRWKTLDQDKDTPPAEVIAAAFETVRAIQREARRVRATGTNWELIKVQGPRGGMHDQVADGDDPNPHALDYWMAKGKGFIRFSEALATFGRSAEVSGKPAAISALARRWLTVPIEQFDCEQMAVNCLSGTLRFVEHRDAASPSPPAKQAKFGVELHPHRREDLITRLAPVEYDPKAEAPLYDGMIAWAQPDPNVRRYVHQVGGYACSGDTGAHLLWFNYGRGRNGKSVSIDSWCASLGDYSGTIGIESFLDQGIKKRGDAASPDLAKLGGVRMLRASEPERGAKLNSALIKAATGGEPMSVRALHRGFFDLEPRFKLLMSGNSKPDIPDTDEGIWGRMKLIPWLRHIQKPDEDPYRDKFPCESWPERDLQLGNKIKAGELPGVFRRLIDGLVDYLDHGFVEPEGVTLATADYRSQSDPLARFLSLCTEREDGSRVKSSDLHDVYAAWCKASGEKEWSAKGFASAMIDKGYTKTRSDGMRWEQLKLVRQESDFIDGEGRVRLLSDDLSTEPHAPQAQAPPNWCAALGDDDDDLPL